MDWLRYAEELAQLLALTALLGRGVARSYPFLTLYLAVCVIRDAALIGLDENSRAYAIRWAWTEIPVISCQIAMALEVLLAVIRNYPGLGRLKRYVIGGSVFAGAALAGIAVSIWPIPNTCEPSWLPGLLGIWKASGWISLGAVVGAYIWNRILPNPLSPNLSLHTKLVAAFVGFGPALTAFALGYQLHIANAAIAFGAMIQIGCCLAWAAWMNPQGEIAPEGIRLSKDHAAQRRMDCELTLQELHEGSSWKALVKSR